MAGRPTAGHRRRTEIQPRRAAESTSGCAVARWVAEEGLSLDVCSAGELAVARAVGFPAGRIVLHPALTTGVEEQKSGLSLTSGAAADVARRVLGQRSLELVGVHCHIGSQVARFGGYEKAIGQLVAFLAWLREVRGTDAAMELDLGGGHAVPYNHGDDDFAIEAFADRVRRVLLLECERHRVPVPRLTVEPGRAIVARAGVTLYRVVAVKTTAGGRRLVAVDGGMGDNLRPSLYGARYTVHRFGRTSPAPVSPATVVGRYCEAGDVLARDVPLPGAARRCCSDVEPVEGVCHPSSSTGRPQRLSRDSWLSASEA
nr:hypothetical protein [Cryptosporangium phraense]